MQERLLISLVILGLVALSPLVVQMYRRRVLARPVSTLAAATLATLQATQVPTILYFTTPECTQCRLQQTPALESLQRDLGNAIAVRKIDAIEAPELVAQYGVMTVPTTVLLNRQGRAVQINYGVAPAPKLRSQIQALL